MGTSPGSPRRRPFASLCFFFFLNAFSFLAVFLSFESGLEYAHAADAFNRTIPYNELRIAYTPADQWADQTSALTDEKRGKSILYKQCSAPDCSATFLFRGDILYYESFLFFYNTSISIDLDGETISLNLTDPRYLAGEVPADSPPNQQTTFLLKDHIDADVDHRVHLRGEVGNPTFGTFIYTKSDAQDQDADSGSGDDRRSKLVVPLAVVGSIAFAAILFALALWVLRFPQYCCAPARQIIWRFLPNNARGDPDQFNNHGGAHGTTGGYDPNFQRGYANDHWKENYDSPWAKAKKSFQSPREWFNYSQDSTTDSIPHHSTKGSGNIEMEASNKKRSGGKHSKKRSEASDLDDTLSPTVQNARQLAIDLPYLRYLDALGSVNSKDENSITPALNETHLAELNQQNEQNKQDMAIAAITRSSSNAKSNLAVSIAPSKTAPRSEPVREEKVVPQLDETTVKAVELEDRGWRARAKDLFRTPTTSMQVTVAGSGADEGEGTLIGSDRVSPKSAIFLKKGKFQSGSSTGAAAQAVPSSTGFGDSMVVTNPMVYSEPPPPISSRDLYKVSIKPLPQASSPPSESGMGSERGTQLIGPRTSTRQATNSSPPRVHHRAPGSQSGTESGHGHQWGNESNSTHAHGSPPAIRPLPLISTHSRKPVQLVVDHNTPSSHPLPTPPRSGSLDQYHQPTTPPSGSSVTAHGTVGRRPLPVPPPAAAAAAAQLPQSPATPLSPLPPAPTSPPPPQPVYKQPHERPTYAAVPTHAQSSSSRGHGPQNSSESYPLASSSPEYPLQDDEDDDMYADYEGTWPPPGSSNLSHGYGSRSKERLNHSFPQLLRDTSAENLGRAAASRKHVDALPPTAPLDAYGGARDAAFSSTMSSQPTTPPKSLPSPPPQSNSVSRSHSSSRKPLPAGYDPVWRPDGVGQLRKEGTSESLVARYTTGKGVPQAGTTFKRVQASNPNPTRSDSTSRGDTKPILPVGNGGGGSRNKGKGKEVDGSTIIGGRSVEGVLAPVRRARTAGS